jgi:type IV pilus assembly protein PilZ
VRAVAQLEQLCVRSPGRRPLAGPILALVPDNDERRSDGPRAPIELKVEYKRLNSFFADYTKNISRGGTFIRTDRPLEIGTDFVFKLGVPTLEEPLVLTGKVQWVITPEQAGADQEPGMGIGFVFESEAQRQRVLGVVERLMRDQLGQVLYEKLMSQRAR